MTELFTGPLQELMKQGVLGLLLVIAFGAIGYLYLSRDKGREKVETEYSAYRLACDLERNKMYEARLEEAKKVLETSLALGQSLASLREELVSRRQSLEELARGFEIMVKTNEESRRYFTDAVKRMEDSLGKLLARPTQ